MRDVPLLEWLSQRNLAASAVYSGPVTLPRHLDEERACNHATIYPSYTLVVCGEMWAVEFSDGGPPVCRVLPYCPEEREVARLYEDTLERRGYLHLVNPARDEARRLLPMPPVVIRPAPPASPPAVPAEPWDWRGWVDRALVRLAWLGVGVLWGLAIR